MFGSYLGFLEFDGIRYWDAREILPFKMKVFSNLNIFLDFEELIEF